MTYWLGVVSADHVRRGVELGIAQDNHGRRAGLLRLHAGDWLVYYSPRQSLGDGEPLQAFTALGRVHDDDLWQADEGEFRPWRRRVDYVTEVTAAPIRPLVPLLHLTSSPHWGVQLRRGLLELSEHDFSLIDSAMRSQ